jgi:ketosteroid isomerase-like protein
MEGNLSTNPTRLGALLTIVVVLTCAAGCTSRAGAKTDPQATAVRASLDKFFDAATRGDWESTADLMSADFLMYTDGVQVFDKGEYLRQLRADDLKLDRYQLRDVTTGVAGSGDMAWMTYKGYFESTTHGKPSRMETAETLLFRNESGKWRMFRAHASVRDLSK